ncbi:MAG TPA: HAMP domain-containing sensor histidine kinase [Thermoanaerobaculia bacterium]|jgi:signal transduction histidine kinase
MEHWLESFAQANFRRSADTAHDLKTPLNVAVLNLELLRMRMRRLSGGDDDEKLAAYAAAIETELRRLGRIFDAFFLLSTPPKDEGAPAVLDIAPICESAAAAAGVELQTDGAAPVVAHEARIRQALKLFFEGAAKLLPSGRRASVETDAQHVIIAIDGTLAEPAELEVNKLFKFYYTDPQGNPDLSLAIARLIAETYGGELHGGMESDKVSLRLTFPLGAR